MAEASSHPSFGKRKRTPIVRMLRVQTDAFSKTYFMDSLLHQELTNTLIKIFYKVYNQLGYGFLEKVYENAMAVELRKLEIPFRQQQPIDVYYDGERVGFFRADLVVDTVVVAELKAAECFCLADEAQLVNYLRATPVEVGLLFNFGRKPEFRRKIFTNDRKELLGQKFDPS